MIASVEQQGGMIKLASDFNLVNVKVARASIDILGKVYAGYDFDTGKTGGARGTVRAESSVKTSIGYDAKGNALDGMPLAVSVAVADASVNVGEKAEIHAARDIELDAKSELKIHTRADSGKIVNGLPVAVAVSALVNDVSAVVDGTLDAGRNIKASAAGTITATTIADKGKGQSSASGGFIGVTVAEQDGIAKIGEHAKITAGGSVDVRATAVEKVDSRAVSSNEKSGESGGGAFDAIKEYGIKLITEKALPWVQEKFHEWHLGKDNVQAEKLAKAVKKIASSNKSVQIDDKAQRHGEVKVSLDETTGSSASADASIRIKPNDGYKVKKVYWRGYNPGENSYKVEDITDSAASDGVYTALLTAQNITVFVEYEESDGTAVVDDLFGDDDGPAGSLSENDDLDLESLINELQNGPEEEEDDSASQSDDDDEDDEDDEDEGTAELKLTGEGGGAVLNYESDPEHKEKSNLKIIPGESLRLIPNPSNGKALTKGGLTATYKVKEGEKTVTKTVVINPDGQNRYIYKVPEDIILEEGLTIKGVFAPSDSQNAAANTTQTQITGAVGVVVADNDANAVIDAGAVVTSGGSLTVDSSVTTDIGNTADATAASKDGAASAKKKDDYAIKRPETANYSGFDAEGRQYGLMLETVGGDADNKVTFAAAENVYNKYTFTPAKKDGYSVSGTLVYYVKGKRQTMALTPDGEGKFTVDLNGVEGLDQGSIAQVSFAFVSDSENVTLSGGASLEAIIPNPIQISYTALKGDDKKPKKGSMGSVYADGTAQEDGKTWYVFTASVKDTYVLDAEKFIASWKGADGTAQTKKLEKKDNQWRLDASGIPTGALITVSAAFKDDLHSFKTGTAAKNGTVTLHDEQIKATDKPKITVKPDAGYSVDEITVSYKGKDGTSATTKLTLSGKSIAPAKDKDGKVIADVYEFTLADNIFSGSDVSVTASFKMKTIGLYAGENDKDKNNVKFSEYNVATGDKVTVTPNDAKTKQGYKVTKITVKDASGAEVASSTDGSFVVPKDKDIADNAKLTVVVETGLKEIELKAATLEKGKVAPVYDRADRGETVTVKVTPDSGYRIDTGTFKAVVKAKDGSYSTEVYMNRKDDTTYTFVMPSDVDPAVAQVSFIGAFIPGQSDNGAYETSLGAGIAVTVDNSESRAEIKGTANSGGNVNVSSAANGTAKTEAKAGYSKTNTGFAGGIAVQVASNDSKALIHNSADVKLDGELKLKSAAASTFTVTGDASGNKEAGNVGVGAGIAVAVNGSDSFAAVQDGAKLAAKTADKKIRGISAIATQKLKDSVTAKAGAAGGTAVVPVAAVDVTGGNAQVYVGRLQSGYIDVDGNVGLSASNEAEHAISADASAIGKGAGIGAAVAVSVLGDESNARLNQSVKANQVTVAAETAAKATETAKAGAEGGKKSGGSADSKANGLLGSASKLAGKNKSSSVSSSMIDKAMKDRQKGETSEGSVGVAGAVAVNVQDSASRAEIMDGVNIDAAGLVSVTALNGTTSIVKANASATNSNIGVGVGVAVNIVALDNIARLGDGEIKAALLAVTALTKETAPSEEKKETPKVATYDDLTNQLGGLVEEYINKLIVEMGLDQYGLSKDMLGEIAGSVTKEVAQTLLDATGLKELLGTGDISEKYDAALKLLNDSKEGLLSLPEKLLEPFMEALGDACDLSQLTAEQLSQLKDDLITAFKANIIEDLKTSGMGVLDGVKDGMIKYLKDKGGDLFSGLFSGHFKENVGKVFIQAKDELIKAVKKELKNLVVKTFERTVKEIKLPGVTMKNVDAAVDAFRELKTAYKAGNVDNILSSVAGYVSDTFRAQVFDYEAMITRLSKVDFATTIADTLRTAAKKASVALTNAALGALSDHFDLKLSVQSAPTGHVIDTQAIAGAGARDVGVAGSVAITVLNAQTSAAIADSGKAVTVSGNMTVEAKELRNVNNVASAALDANGNASKNKSSDEAANADVAKGNNTITGNHVTLDLGAGATGEIRKGDMSDDKPKIYVSVKDGYKLPDVVDYSYTDSEGQEKKGTIAVTKSGDQYVIDPKSGDLAGLAGDKDVRLKLTPEEILNKLPKPEVLTDVDVPEGAVTVSVVGREAENGTLSAREGDIVELKIAKGEGRKVTSLGYSYTDANGKSHDVEIVAGTEVDPNNLNNKEKAYTLRTNNANEYVYTIEVPKGAITAFVVQIEEGEEDEAQASETTAKDGTGKSVGVGAAFSMIYGDADTKATIGKRSVTAGALTMNAASKHTEDIAAAAGTDPLKGETDMKAMKDTAVDAAVALNILDSDILTSAAKNAAIVTTGGTDIAGDLTATASEDSSTEIQSSAFAAGGETAVGASVAVNIAITSARVELDSGATVAGKATVGATGHSADVTKAIATAMGADIARNLNKLGEGANDLNKKANKLLDGSYVDTLTKSSKKPAGTKTNNKIADRLNEKKNDKKDGNADGSLSLSQNVLRSQGVKVQGEGAGNEGTGEALSQIEGATGTKLGGGVKEESSKFQVAAAVGVTVSDHEVLTQVGKITSGGDISVTADNEGNFQTMGTGAAMSFADHANSIAAGVAVSVNRNLSNVYVDGDLISEQNGDVTVTSKLTQNLSDEFAGKLAAQAISGSVAGKKSDISLAGAVTVLVSGGEAIAQVSNATSKAHGTIKGGKVTVEAIDKSRLTARAGGLSLSKGSSVGMGIASANVVSNNTVTAKVGNYIDITAGSFKLNAEKQAVTIDDYVSPVGLRTLVTDSSDLTDEQRKKAETGLIDMHKGEKDDSYKVDINLSTDRLLKAVDALNFLSAQNTYVEAIAGSVIFGSGMDSESKASIAGSFAVAVAQNRVEATTGSYVTVNLKKDDARDGGMTINADNGATSRVIAGSLSAGPAKAAVGATVAVLVDSDRVAAESGRNASVDIDGDFTQKAVTSGDIQVFTGAMSVSTGSQGDATAAGGAVNVIVTKNVTESSVGNNAKLTSRGNLAVNSATALDLMVVSGSANVAAGSGSSVAAGGTINVIVDKSTSQTKLGSGNTLKADGDLSLTSDVSDQLISGTASLSVAVGGSGKSGAGVVNVIVSKSVADTTVGASADLEATKGDLKVTAGNDAWMLNAGMAVSGGQDFALGGAFNVNVFNRTASVNMADGTLTAGRDLITQAKGNDFDIMAGLSIAGAANGSAVSGNVVVAVMNSKVTNRITSGVTATAGNSAVMETAYSGFDIAAAGNVAASGSSAAVGVTAVTYVRNNEVATELAASNVTAQGDGAVKNLSGKDVSGVYVGANAVERQYVAGAGIAASGSAGVNGVVAVLVNNNQVIADAHLATLKAEKADIDVAAKDDTFQLLLAGGLTVSGGAGVGAAVTTLVSNKRVEAVALNMEAAKNVSVNAKNSDDVIELAVSAGISGGAAVQIGAAVQVLKSRAVAHVGTVLDDGTTKKIIPGTVTATNGSFSLNAENDSTLKNIGVAVALSGSAAVTPVGVVTYFQGEADARVRENTRVSAAGDIDITAKAEKNIDMYSVGAAAGSMGISGTVNVLVSKDKTNAVAETGTSLKSTGLIVDKKTVGSVNIQALNDYTLRTASAALGGGSVGVAVNAVVSVLKSNVTAELGGIANAAKDVAVKADSTRDVVDLVATLGAGSAGVGVTAMVLVAGTKMSQDAADMVAYGNASSKSKKDATFDAETFMTNINANGAASKYYEGSDEEEEDRKLDGKILAEDIAGNGHSESETQVGGTTQQDGEKVGTFDGASGYRSSDFDNTNFNDEGEAQRGEKQQGNDTKDVENAKNLNTYVYDDAPSDAVIARITSTGSVEKAEGVSVTADQKVSADLFGATVGAGAVGVGISAAVAILHSNVTASSVGSIQRVGEGGITIHANSHSGDAVDDAAAKERSSALKKVLGDLDPSKRAIRAVGVTMGAGEVGVAVGVSVLLTDNFTQAILGGKVETRGATRVNADHDYGNVMAATVSVSGGLVAAGASVAVAQANGSVKAEVAEKAVISTGDLTLGTDTKVNVNALAATASAGLVSANAGVGLAFNRLTQSTAIRKGAKVTTTGDLTMTAKSGTTADSNLIGVSFGGVGAALGAAVSDLDAKIDTAIESATVNVGGKLALNNDVSSSVTPKLLSVAAGLGAISGNVLLAFNESRADARIDDSTITAGELEVVSDLGSEAVSSLASLSVGGAAIGISVNYADLRAQNIAAVRGGTVDVKGDMNVLTGAGANRSTIAKAETVSATVGSLAVGLNAAIARNNTKNNAVLTDIASLSVGKALTVHASGSATTDASLLGLSIGASRAAATAVVALNDADNHTIVKVNKAKVDGRSTFNATQEATTDANIKTGGGSLIALVANVAVAYGRASSVVDVELHDATEMHDITAINKATDTPTSTITNQSYDVLSAAAMIGAAYSQEVFSTSVRLTGDSTVNGDVDIQTNYWIAGKADVTPSAGGIDLSLAKIAVNAALARNTAYIGAALEGAGGANTIDGNVNIAAIGSASTDALIHSANITASYVSLGANVVNSDLSAEQMAKIAVDGTLHITGSVNVDSEADTAYQMRQSLKLWKAQGQKALNGVDVEKLSDAEVAIKYKEISGAAATEALASSAIVGTSGGKSIDIGLVNIKTNHAYASERMDNTAAIMGSGADTSLLQVDGDMKMFAGVREGTHTSSLARTDGAMSIGIATVGNLDGDARSGDSFNVMLRDVAVDVVGGADFKTRTDTSAYGHGTAPGSLALIDVGISNIRAGIGTKDDKETSKILVGDGAKLLAGTINMETLNQGATEAFYKKGTTIALAAVGVSSQPTESYYDTGVQIGKGAVVEGRSNVNETADGKYALNILTETKSQAASRVSAKQIALGFNVEVMQGTNMIHDDNIIEIGEGARVETVGSMNMRTLNNTSANAETDLMGLSAFSGTFSGAKNIIDRVGRIDIKNGSTLKATNGTMNLTTISGTADDIYTNANADSGGIVVVGKATAETTLESENSILIGKNVNMISALDMNLTAQSTSHKANGTAGVTNKSVVDAGALEADVHSEATVDLLFLTAVYINQGGDELTQLQTNTVDTENFKHASINILAHNAGVNVTNNTRGKGGAAVGFVHAIATINPRLQNVIWVDKANLYTVDKVNLLATNAPEGQTKPYLSTTSHATIYGLGGTLETKAIIKGDANNQIRTTNKKEVRTKGSQFIHKAIAPRDAMQNPETKADYTLIAIADPKKEAKTYWNAMKHRCDFCAEGESVTPMALKAGRGTDMETAMKKALSPIHEVESKVSALKTISKSRYGQEEDKAADAIYALEVESLLEKDALLLDAQLKKYTLWTNAQTQYQTVLLPNATRLYRKLRLDFVTEILNGDVRGDSGVYDIDIFTALNANAFANPVVPIGANASLDFSTGAFTLPAQADFELYLDEVSGAWLLSQFDGGEIRRLIADQNAINRFANGDSAADAPTGDVTEGLSDGGMADGWRRLWLGHTPDTAERADETLVYLLLDEATDEIDAFRTSVNGIEAGEAPVSVSLFIYRDGRFDRMGEVKYNVMFFDTPKGEESVVRVLTDVLENRAIEVPQTFKIVLRGTEIDGADYPMYSLTDHFFAICDATDGAVSMFGGFYTATFDGDTFDSDYTRIEGILSDDLNVTIKANQSVWPEETGDNSADDIQGKRFVRVNGAWQPAAPVPAGAVAA